MSQPTSEHFSAALTWVGLALLLFLLYLVVEPFFVPLGWACVIAVLSYPTFLTLAGRMGRSRAAVVATIAAAVVLIAPAVVLTNAFAREMVDIARSMQSAFAEGRTSALERTWEQFMTRLPVSARVDLGTLGYGLLQRSATFLMAQSGAILTNVAVFFVDLALALFATFFLLRDGDIIMHAVRRLLPMRPALREAFIARTGDLIAAGVTSSVIVAGLQGLLGGLSFAIVGIAAPVFWGVTMGFICLLPFGAWVIWLPAAIFLIASGSITKGLVLIGLGAGVVGMVDNIVRPMLLSGRVQMNGLVIFISLLGGLNVFGLLGIVVGPIVVVTALALVESYVESAPDEERDDVEEPLQRGED